MGPPSLPVCGVCGAMRSQAQPAVGTARTAETQSGSRVIQVPECTRDVVRTRVCVAEWGARESGPHCIMRSLFSLLVVAATPYTRTHMVTEAVSDPSERRLYGLFEVAACGSAPQTTNNTDDEGDIDWHDNHCDNTTYDGVGHATVAVQSKTRLLPNSTVLQQRSTTRVAAAASSGKTPTSKAIRQ